MSISCGITLLTLEGYVKRDCYHITNKHPKPRNRALHFPDLVFTLLFSETLRKQFLLLSRIYNFWVYLQILICILTLKSCLKILRTRPITIDISIQSVCGHWIQPGPPIPKVMDILLRETPDMNRPTHVIWMSTDVMRTPLLRWININPSMVR